MKSLHIILLLPEPPLPNHAKPCFSFGNSESLNFKPYILGTLPQTYLVGCHAKRCLKFYL